MCKAALAAAVTVALESAVALGEVRLGGGFQLNDHTILDQFRSVVASDDRGNFVVSRQYLPPRAQHTRGREAAPAA